MGELLRRRWSRPLVIVLSVIAAAGLAYVKVRVTNAMTGRDDTEAPALEPAWRYRGGTESTTRVGVYPIGRVIRWRVHSPGTTDCRPKGYAMLWNFVHGEVTSTPALGFTDHGHYADTERLEGVDYRQVTTYRIRGRIGPASATGTFWRRDRMYREGRLAFSCVRGGRWSSPG